MTQNKCPCGSNKEYLLCCAPYHQGEKAPTAEALLRARFSAYALNLPRFIIATTHPDNPAYQKNMQQWEQHISQFSTTHHFEKVEILDITPGEEETTIRFIAHLKRGHYRASFMETSRFVKQNGHWLYRSGVVAEHSS